MTRDMESEIRERMDQNSNGNNPTNGDTDGIWMDYQFAHWVWEHINQSARVYWPDSERLTMLVDEGFETEEYYRSGKHNYDDPTDWTKSMGATGPPMRMSPVMSFHDDGVRSVRIAAISYTIIGSWYTFEVVQDRDEPAVFDPIRLPVTDDMLQEARQWGRGHGGEHLRTKGVEFQERFVEVSDTAGARRASQQLNDVHVRIPNVQSERHLKDIVTEATDMAERAVRKVL